MINILHSIGINPDAMKINPDAMKINPDAMGIELISASYQ